MAVTTIRPNGTVSTTSDHQITGAASAHAALSDNSDASYQEQIAAGFRQTICDCGTFTITAGEMVKSLQARIRAGDASNTVQVRIYNGAGTQLQADQFSLTGTITTYSGTTYVLPSAFSQSDLDAIRVAWDDGPFSNGPKVYELYLDVTTCAAPTTSAVTPSGAITTTRAPAIGWTYTQATNGTAQGFFQVRIFTAAQYGIGGFDPATSPNTYDSGTIASASTSHTPTSYLDNGVTYKAYVRTAQTVQGGAQWSTWVASSAFNIAITVPVPTSVIPAASSTVTTSRPALSANVAAMTGGSQTRREWQLASDSGFTTNLYSRNEGTYSTTPSGSVAFTTAADRLPQGVWYVRCRAQDEDGVYGSYSAGQSFTVAHAPSNSITKSPSANVSIQYDTTPDVNWTFSDPDSEDFQSAYQVQMWPSFNPTDLFDSGKITSALSAVTLAASSVIDATWKGTELRWKLKVWDQDDVNSGYSPESTFYMYDLPVVAITAPAAAAVIATSAPLVTWTDTLTGGRTQAQFKVDIIRGGVTQITSGWISGTALSWQVPSPVVTVGPTHTVTVTVIDSVGLTGTSSNNFTASYSAPTTPTFTVDSAAFPTSGYYTLDWSGASVDASFAAWRVYRRNQGDTTWSLLYETSTVGTRSYRDYLVPSQQGVEYAVVQVGVSFGVQVESVYAPASVVATLSKYILVCPSNETLNCLLYNVISDNFEDEVEIAVHKVIGRGRRIEYGTNFGKSGDLSCQLYDQTGKTARAQRLELEALRDAHLDAYFKNPFGDVWKVAMSSLRFTRVPGVGLHEAMTAALQYQQLV